MEVRIAVASSDGINVDLHFGRARDFLIYRMHDDGYEYLETRVNDAPRSGDFHDDNDLDQAAVLLSDCRGVIAARIGPGAIDALIYRRILAFTLPGTIDMAFQTLAATRKSLVRHPIFIAS